ncbi:MAG: hypothetical protein Kow0025_05490 [Thermodesulfovibrionales bacterium]
MSTNICAVCAWRENCQKKFTVSGRDIRCPDFTKDLSIGQGKEEAKEPPEEKAETGKAD